MTLLKRVLANLALIVAGIIVALLIGEAVLRLTPLGKTALYTYDPHLGWTLKPGARALQDSEGHAWVRVNRWGYRGPNWTLKKPAGTLRIAVVGDSFTEAQQVPENDTFCMVAQRALDDCPMLRAHGYTRVEVLNFGCDGYGTAQELITLKRRVWKFSPDLILVAVYLGNDIRNNSVVLEGDKCRPFYVLRGGRMVLGGPFEDSRWFRFGCMTRFESRHFQILNTLGEARSAVRAWWRKRKARERAAHAGPPQPPKPGVNDLVYAPSRDQVWRDAWGITAFELGAINRNVVRHHAHLLVVTLSTPTQDDPDAATRAAYAKWLGVKDLFFPDRVIASLGKMLGFPVLTLAPAMQQFAQTHQVYLHGFDNTAPGEGHWNVLGHELAGRLIARRICAMLAAGKLTTPAQSPPRLQR